MVEEHLIAPVMWLEEIGHVDKANADKLRDKVFGPKKTYTGILIGDMALGALSIVVAAAIAFFRRW